MYRRATAAALVIAPLLFLVDNLIHPKEVARGNEAEQLAAIAGAYQRWQLAHFINFVSILVFAVAILGLAYMVRRRRPTLGLVAGGLALGGLVGLAGVLALDGFTWGILGETWGRPGIHKPSIESAFHDVQNSEWNLYFYFGALTWIIGLIALAVSLRGVVPTAAIAVFSLGAVMVGIEGAVADNAYFIAAAAVLFAGGAWLGLAVWRLSDGAFANERAR